MTIHPTPLSLDAYRALFRDAPRLSDTQIDFFISEFVEERSWYKHLPLMPPGVPFCFYLDPFAGIPWVGVVGGPMRPQVVEQGDLHLYGTEMPTRRYREHFGFLRYFATERPLISLNESTDPSQPRCSEASYDLPASVVAVCKVELTGVIHRLSKAQWLWSNYFAFRDDDQVNDYRWPEESGGPDVPRAIHVLLNHIEQCPADSPLFSDAPIEILVAPERNRQLRAIRSAIEAMLDLVYSA